jgi:hypothetical protein
MTLDRNPSETAFLSKLEHANQPRPKAAPAQPRAPRVPAMSDPLFPRGKPAQTAWPSPPAEMPEPLPPSVRLLEAARPRFRSVSARSAQRSIGRPTTR